MSFNNEGSRGSSAVSNVRIEKRCDFHFARTLSRTRNGATRTEGTTHGAAVERVRISLDHFDRAGLPLCAYYVFITAAYQESRDKTIGASRTSPFAPPRDLFGGTVPHNVRENPVVPARGLINWHHDTCPAGLGGPLAFNDTRQSHRFRSLSSIASLVAEKKLVRFMKMIINGYNLNYALYWILCLITNIVW